MNAPGTTVSHLLPQGEPIIRMARVEKWFGKFKVLSGIDLDVQPGERIVVCGPSRASASRP